MSVEREKALMRETLETTAAARAPGWLPEQMAKCPHCQRASAPTRPTCIYCGAAIPVTAETAELRKPLLRDLETGEMGFNVVVAARANYEPMDDARQVKAADLLRLDAPQLQAILNASGTAEARALPLARAPSRAEADLLARQLGNLGLRLEIVSDKILSAESLPPKRMRAFEFTERSITGWTFGEAEELRLSWSEIALVLVGRVFVRQVEVEERRARGGPEKELVDAREIDSDEVVVDIYSGEQNGGWRVSAHAFDFSCLGQSKGLIAAENINKLIGVVRERASGAAFDDGYYRLRATLEPVWPLEQRTESRGWRRARSGGFNSEAAAISTNLSQFTFYSRLRHHFLRQSEDKQYRER